MKKIILIVMLIVSLIGCRENLNDRGTITDKGIDRINMKALFDSIDIESTANDKNFQELYWIIINSSEEKIYINLFTYESFDVGEYIILGPEAADIRFSKEW